MSIVCLLKILNRYIRLAESLCSVNYVQPYMLQIHEENLYDHGSVFEISVISWLVSGDASRFLACLRQFYIVSGRSRSFLVLISTSRRSYKKQCIGQQGRTLEILWVEENWENNATTAMLNSWIRKKQIIQNISLQSLKTLNCTSFY